MAYIDQYQLLSNELFVDRFAVALVKAAGNIYNEGAQVTAHAARAQLARQVAQSPQVYASQFALTGIAQGLTQASLDSDIDNSIASNWNMFAGA